jgi:plasmid stability protein
MVTLTIENLPERIYEQIKARAKRNHLSINDEILTILEHEFSLTPIDVQAMLERTSKVRELTANYMVTADEIGKMINEGRE